MNNLLRASDYEKSMNGQRQLISDLFIRIKAQLGKEHENDLLSEVLSNENLFNIYLTYYTNNEEVLIFAESDKTPCEQTKDVAIASITNKVGIRTFAKVTIPYLYLTLSKSGIDLGLYSREWIEAVSKISKDKLNKIPVNVLTDKGTEWFTAIASMPTEMYTILSEYSIFWHMDTNWIIAVSNLPIDRFKRLLGETMDLLPSCVTTLANIPLEKFNFLADNIKFYEGYDDVDWIIAIENIQLERFLMIPFSKLLEMSSDWLKLLGIVPDEFFDDNNINQTLEYSYYELKLKYKLLTEDNTSLTLDQIANIQSILEQIPLEILNRIPLKILLEKRYNWILSVSSLLKDRFDKISLEVLLEKSPKWINEVSRLQQDRFDMISIDVLSQKSPEWINEVSGLQQDRFDMISIDVLSQKSPEWIKIVSNMYQSDFDLVRQVISRISINMLKYSFRFLEGLNEYDLTHLDWNGSPNDLQDSIEQYKKSSYYSF